LPGISSFPPVEVTETVRLKPEHLAQLENLARAAARAQLTRWKMFSPRYLEWERQGYQEALEGIRQSYEDPPATSTRRWPVPERRCCKARSVKFLDCLGECNRWMALARRLSSLGRTYNVDTAAVPPE
jgi:hypothetical protein